MGEKKETHSRMRFKVPTTVVELVHFGPSARTLTWVVFETGQKDASISSFATPLVMRVPSDPTHVSFIIAVLRPDERRIFAVFCH